MAYRIGCDIHTHTLYTGHAYSTLGENVAAARAAGLEVLGSADHFSSMLAPVQDIRNFQFFLNQVIWPREWDGVTVLRGAEADIVSLKGDLFGQDIEVTCDITGSPLEHPIDLFSRVARSLDYLVASVHNKDFAAGATVAQGTEMYLGALENPKVFVLGHTGRAGVAYEIDEVLLAAKDKHKLIEINNHSLDAPADHPCHASCRKIAERCAELGVGITISTDAHIAPAVGRFDNVTAMLEEIHFPQELIMNRDRKTLLTEMAAAGVCDLTDLL